MRSLPAAPFGMQEIDLAEPLRPIEVADGEGGVHLLVRYRGTPVDRIWLVRGRERDRFEPNEIAPRLADARERALALDLTRVQARPGGDPPSLTVAVCTRNRPELLRRCLVALTSRCGHDRRIDFLVVDNAPPDESTREAVQAFSGIRYVVEPVPGLDFARNRALAATDRAWLAYVDDDAVIDQGWFTSLAEGIAATPGAGGFTGPVLPLVLETDAQIRFEWAGGFGRGFRSQRVGPEQWGTRYIRREREGRDRGRHGVLDRFPRRVGGFDEALDTGPPLPAGGDIDMFYRVIRAGCPLVYLPGLLVHHEHRRDLPGLASQYHSWGLALMALDRKNARTDPAMCVRNRRYRRWWLRTRVGSWRVRLRAADGGRRP